MAPDYANQRAIGPGRMRSGKIVLLGNLEERPEWRIWAHVTVDSPTNTPVAVQWSQPIAAIVITLRPGAHTAMATSPNGTSGHGLLEVYEEP